jgi:pimeloyl-ACP methyl ester carboxylesterase
MTPVVESVTLPGGLRLPYVEQGEPSGVPVVLLHGVTDSWRSFEPVLPYLPPSIHAFAVTQRGHGDADRPATGYHARDFTADVAAFADAVGLGRVLVVGHSMGSTHARRFAIDHPDRTLGLVLVSAFAGFRGNPAARDFWESVVAHLTDPIDPAVAREFQESTLARPIPPAYLETVVQESLKVPARVWRATFERFFDDDALGDARAIRAPTMVMWGTRDAFCPRGDQDLLLAAIAGARLVVYENAGHALHWEEPQRFAADLVAFATSVAG